MSKRLFSATFLSSVLLAGTAFSMEESETESALFGGKAYSTPQSKAKIQEYETEYPNTVFVKQKAKEKLGDLEGVSANLARLVMDEAEQDALREREKRRNEVARFLGDRELAREYEQVRTQSEQELRAELLQIRQHTEFVKKDISEKLQEIATLTASSAALESELTEATDKVKALEHAKTEDLEEIGFYKRRVSLLSESLSAADEQLNQLEKEKSKLVHHVGMLTLQRDSTKSLLKAYSPLKKVLASTNAAAVVAFTARDVDGSTQVPGQESKDKDDEKSDSDSDFDLND